MSTIFFLLLLFIYRRNLLPPVWKMFLQIPNLPLIAENIIIYSNKTFQVLRLKKILITLSHLIKFLVYICGQRKNLQDQSFGAFLYWCSLGSNREKLILLNFSCLQKLSYWFIIYTVLLHMSGVIYVLN